MFQLTQLFENNSPKRKEMSDSFYMLATNVSKMLDLPEDKKGEAFLACLEVVKKLAKVADAVDEYEKAEAEVIKEVLEKAEQETASVPLVRSLHSGKLEGLVEEVLSQAKSSLDVAVKVLRPLLGINLTTFGNAGKDVVKALNGQTPKDLKPRLEGIVGLIEDNRDWLGVLRKLRTDAQHNQNITVEIRAQKGVGAEQPVMPGGQPINEFVNALYDNLFFFLQDFLASAMYVRLIPGLVVAIQGEGKERQFGVGIPPEAIKHDG